MDRSGWCMKPLNERTQEEHDGCYLHFQTRDCACDCGHKGKKTLEEREMTFQPYTPPRKQLATKENNEQQ